jgi:hypothetical protein
MDKTKYPDFFYLIYSAKTCSACWIEQKVMQNFGGKNEERRPPGRDSTDRRTRIRAINLEETEW